LQHHHREDLESDGYHTWACGKRILKRLVDSMDRRLPERDSATSMTALIFFVLAARTALKNTTA
jgi:hypothetical protein